MIEAPYTSLWNHVIKHSMVHELSVHSLDHWLRVERNGLYLSRFTGADHEVVQLFALFHDCMRINDADDDGHGQRGADFAQELKHSYFEIEDTAFERLYIACASHTDELFHDDVTIGTCWDADRLDIGRIGLVANPAYLNTDIAKTIAAQKRFDYLEQMPLRTINPNELNGK